MVVRAGDDVLAAAFRHDESALPVIDRALDRLAVKTTPRVAYTNGRNLRLIGV